MAFEQPFSYTVTGTGDVRVTRDGRLVAVIAGKDAYRLVARLGDSAEEDQLLLAKATGNYRRGNEKAKGRRP